MDRNLEYCARMAQQGDQAAFGALLERYQDMAFTTAYLRLGDEALAEDAAQEAFIEAYLHIGSLRRADAFPAWLRRIVIHRCNRFVRRKAHAVSSLEEALELPAPDPDPVDQLMVHERRLILRRIIDILPDHERAAVLFHYISGYSQNEVADFLEIPAATVRKRLQSARKRLRENITTMSEDYFERRPSRGPGFGRTVTFFIAVRTGEIVQAGQLLQEDPTLAQAPEQWSETFAELYPRAQPHKAQLVQLMKRRRHGWTPVQWAVHLGNLEMTQLLLRNGADPQAVDLQGLPLLVTAARGGHDDIARLLIEEGADPNGGEAPWGPLHAAAGTGRIELVQLLLKHEADVDRPDRFGRTPLCWAAANGYREAVALLLAQGADPEHHDEKGRTPGWWALRSGYPVIVDMWKEKEGREKQGHATGREVEPS